MKEAIYQSGKKKERATKTITYLTSVQADIKGIIFDAPNYLGLLEFIEETLQGLKIYRKRLDE